MHGFSVAAVADDDGDDSAANAQKRPREASLPSANPMRVVLPSGQSDSGVSPAASSTSGASPVAPTTIVGIADSLSEYNRSKAGASDEYESEDEEEEAAPPQPAQMYKSSKPHPGRVVETGQEHTGRWTKEEHDAFLIGLKMYGKEWKK